MPLLLLVALGLLAWLAVRQFGAISRQKRVRAPQRKLTEQLTDPREAAAILLVQQAAYEGGVTVEQKHIILALMRGAFGVDAGEAEGLYSFGRMAIGQTGDAANALRRLVRPIKEACTLEEMKDLAGMMEQVGEASGPMNDHQRRLVNELRRALNLPAPQAAGPTGPAGPAGPGSPVS